MEVCQHRGLAGASKLVCMRACFLRMPIKQDLQRLLAGLLHAAERQHRLAPVAIYHRAAPAWSVGDKLPQRPAFFSPHLWWCGVAWLAWPRVLLRWLLGMWRALRMVL